MTIVNVLVDIPRGYALNIVLQEWTQSIFDLSDGLHDIRILMTVPILRANAEVNDAGNVAEARLGFVEPPELSFSLPGVTPLSRPLFAAPGAASAEALFDITQEGQIASDYSDYGVDVLAASFGAGDVLFAQSDIT